MKSCTCGTPKHDEDHEQRRRHEQPQQVAAGVDDVAHVRLDRSLVAGQQVGLFAGHHLFAAVVHPHAAFDPLGLALRPAELGAREFLAARPGLGRGHRCGCDRSATAVVRAFGGGPALGCRLARPARLRAPPPTATRPRRPHPCRPGCRRRPSYGPAASHLPGYFAPPGARHAPAGDARLIFWDDGRRPARADRARLLRRQPDRGAGRRRPSPTAGGRARPADDLTLAPQSDGGPGFVDVLASRLGELRHARVSGPLDDDVDRRLGVRRRVGHRLHRVRAGMRPGAARRPPTVQTAVAAHSTGVGQLIDAALRAGRAASSSDWAAAACTDGGRGLVDALGGLDAGPCPAGRRRPDRGHRRRTPAARPDGRGAVFGPQKGADPPTVALLEARLTEWAAELDRVAGRTSARSPAPGRPGASARRCWRWVGDGNPARR